jgi:cleavage and polyadenylation specificity factor subunit 3
MSAETPEVKPDILIVEATYGVQSLPPVQLREQRFTELVHATLKRGGRCLIPVFALGRAQELLLILGTLPPFPFVAIQYNHPCHHIGVYR